ncbi:MAG: hypothetical protein M3N08_08810, partial [Pseudomonadota bacterium]|nr:hypothetical protein [Pseudomonadota bacterium]
MATVAGVFDNALEANQAITELLETGIARDNISLLMSDKTRTKFFPASDDANDRLVKDAAAGSAAGGAFGALLAGLTAVGSVAIPGAGLLVVGPLMAVLAGAGTGAIAGGLIGAFTAAGLSQADSDKYGAAIKAGKAVVLVHDIDKE